MTKITISLILAIVFIILSFSVSLLPCYDEENFHWCKMGQEDATYYGVTSDEWSSGIITFILVFLIFLALLSIIIPKQKIYPV